MIPHGRVLATGIDAGMVHACELALLVLLVGFLFFVVNALWVERK